MVGLDLQREAQGVDDTPVASSAGHVLDDVGNGHVREVMQCLDDAEAVIERGGPCVLEAQFITGHGERLAVGASHHQIYRCQPQDVRLVNLSYILWDGVVKATCQNVSPQWWTEIVGVVEDHLLKACESNLASDKVLVGEVYFSNYFPTLDEGAEDFHTCPSALAKVSDLDEGSVKSEG